MIPKKIQSQHTFALLFTKQNSGMKKVASKSKELDEEKSKENHFSLEKALLSREESKSPCLPKRRRDGFILKWVEIISIYLVKLNSL